MRRLAFIALSALALLTGGHEARAQAEEQNLVDRATLSLQEVFDIGDLSADARSLLGRSRAAMICPRVIRGGFVVAGQGGDCVLVARDGSGSWSSPAFYTMGGGSIGFQVGIQDAQVVMLIMNDKALDAVLDSQFRFGADAGVALGTLGRGIAGSTTAAVGADIVTIARARGLFAGVSLDGNFLSARSASMRAYFGRDVSPRQVVVGMEAHNPAADPLRAALMRMSQAQSGAAAPQPQGSGAPPAVITPAPGGTGGRVQTESLPSPPRSGTR
ncbi:lipid-binding SYLF domain-containing protein [Roseomonas sp. PWR1]|uniref:Lipid-binding SYLF domain-containing protein n=1 Tax=Roseomonas nitratireducens TaxID=2820810 RepID=A0ABS4ASA1_9PROT|nr:lipid-binding SYLF domain-containing protein [Neoroseomonas nitratireducens]MBP0464129.1 lipid-binding SYLF domain-containing protein [Neoroseomonas nitratireducens]